MLEHKPRLTRTTVAQIEARPRSNLSVDRSIPRTRSDPWNDPTVHLSNLSLAPTWNALETVALPITCRFGTAFARHVSTHHHQQQCRQ